MKQKEEPKHIPKIPHIHQGFVEMFEDSIFGIGLSDQEKNKVAGIVNDIIDEYDEIVRNGFHSSNEKDAEYYFQDSEAMCNTYIDFLIDRSKWLKTNKGDTIKIDNIKPMKNDGSFTETWKAFVEYMKTKSVEMYPS